MLEPIDRLPDWAFLDTELDQMAINIIEFNKYDETPKHICWYHLLKDGVPTGKAMLLAVESIMDGQDAINNVCTDVGLTAQIGEYGEPTAHAGFIVECMYAVLRNYKYIGKLKFTGDDKVYSYQTWMANLV